MSPRLYTVAGIVIALVLFSLPHWFGKGVPVFTVHRSASALHFDEGALYAPGARRFADTGVPAWELDIFEMREARFAYPITHQIVLGALAWLTGGVEHAFAIAHAALPACIWLGFFSLMFRATSQAAFSFLVSWLALLLAASPRNALLLGADAFIQPLEMSRTPHPALSTAILLFALWSTLRVLSHPRSTFVWFAGPLLGLLFYTYYFHAVAAWTALGCIFLFSRDAWRRLLFVIITGLAVAVPYVYWTVSSMRSGISHDLMSRIGLFERIPDWQGVTGVFVCGCIFVAMALRRPKEDTARYDVVWLLVALLVGAFVVTNLHLITGYNAQHEHAYNRLIQPFGLLVAAIVFARHVENRPVVFPGSVARPVVCHTLSIVIIALGLIRQISVARVLPHFASESAAQEAQLRKLNDIKGPLVVGVLDEQIRALLPTLTSHWSFVPIGFRTLASNEEILTRFVVIAKLSGFSVDEARSLLTEKAAAGQMRTFCYGLLDDYSLKAGDEALFTKLWMEIDPVTALKSRRLDIIILPQGKLPPTTVFGITLSLLSSNQGWSAFRVDFTSPPAR